MSEEIGPQIPAHLLLNTSNCNEEGASVPGIGPQLCDSLKRASKQDSDISENAVIGPLLPQERDLPNCKKRTVGPAVMPPPGYSHQEEEENIIGPILPKDFKEGSDDSSLQETIQEFEERAERMRKALEPNDQDDKPLQRGEWMLVPPETKFLGETPINMRSRQFKKRAQDPSDSDNSLWTETPAEREERLRKQATSNQKRKHAKDDDDDDEPVKYSRIDLETAEKVKEYNELYRPKSLLETHSESYVKSRKWQDDDVSKRSFDREKDVLGTRRMDPRKRKEFLDNAKGLNSKFGHGKHGSFL